MEAAIDIMSWPADTEAQIKRVHEALLQQGNALQDFGKTFSASLDKEQDESFSASPLINQAMERCKTSSLGSLHLLAAQAEILQPYETAAFATAAMYVLEHLDVHHTRVAPKQMGTVCSKLAQNSIAEGQACRAILSLRTAALKAGSTTSCLSPVHPEFTQCCIRAKHYRLGTRFLDEQPIFGVDPKETGVTPVHLLRYLYYAGVLYIGVKRWKDANQSFSMLIGTPANVLSALVVQGYKKMFLASLIADGHVPTLPKYTSNIVARQLKHHSLEYDRLAAPFQAGDIAQLRAAVAEGKQVFDQDGNTGLVKQALHALTRRKIMQLTHTYITVSLQDISITAGLTSAEEGEAYVLGTIEEGQICAKIESATGAVLFQEDSSATSSSIITSRLEADLQSTYDLTERVRDLEARLVTNPVFVQKMSGEHSVPNVGLGSTAGYSTWDDISLGD